MPDITLEEVKKNHPDIVAAIQQEALDAAQTNDENAELLKENERLRAEVARANEADTLRQARTFAEKTLESVDLPVVTKERIASYMARDPVIKDGKLDEAEFRLKIDQAVKAESEYLAKVTESGKIKGLGGGKGGTPAAAVSLEESQKALENEFAAFGLDSESAKVAAKGRL